MTFRARTNEDKKAEEVVLRRFEYNTRGQLLAESDVAGVRTAYCLTGDPNGKGIEVTHPGRTSQIDSVRYDPCFRPVEARYADGRHATWSYPKEGGVVLELLNSAGERLRFTESADHRRRVLESAGGSAITGEYDAAGRLTALLENGHTVLHQEWSGDGRLLGASQESCVAHIGYSPDGLISRVVLSPVGEQGPFTRWQETTFDSAGRACEITDCRGLQVRVNYDSSGRLAAMTYNQVAREYGFSISRDQTGRVCEVKSSWGKQRYAYDATGSIEKVDVERNGKGASMQWQSGLPCRCTQFDGGQISVEYHHEPSQQGLPREIRLPNDLRLCYDYDKRGRATRVNVGSRYQMELAYDAEGRLYSLTQSASRE